MKTYVHEKALMRMFTAASLIIVKIREQPKCSSAGEWVRKL